MDTSHKDQYIYLSYIAQFFLEWETFQTKFVHKIKAQIMVNKIFFENCACREIM
jgi:hypothetical protein